MTGEFVGARSPSPARKPSSEPPGIDRVAGAFARSARWYLVIGLVTSACALALLGGVLFGLVGKAGTTVYLYAVAFVLVLAALPFVQAWRRLQRVAFLASVRSRWAHLSRAGDPNDQIATLRRAYAGLIGNDIRTRMAAPR
jgi:hypothetical protein